MELQNSYSWLQPTAQSSSNPHLKGEEKKPKLEDEDEAIFEMASSTESNSQPRQPKPEKDQRAASTAQQQQQQQQQQPLAKQVVVLKSPADDPSRKFISEIESPASETQMFSFQQLQHQHEQSKSRKLSLKEKRKLRAERELTPRDVEQAAMPAGIVTPPPQPVQELSQTFQKQFLAHPPMSGGSPSPPGRSGGESDHSNRSELSPNHPEPGDNGAGFTVQLPSRDRAASREFAVSRALGKYREKQKQQQNSQSNSDSQEELERTPNSTTPTPKSSPPRISMIEPEMDVPTAKDEKSSSPPQVATEVKEEPPPPAKKTEADLEATLKNLDAKLAEFECSIKPVSEFVPNVVTQSTLEEEDELEEEDDEAEKMGESKDTEDDLDEDEDMMGEGPSSTDDGSPEMELDTSANEDQFEDVQPRVLDDKKEPDHTVLQDLVTMDTNQLQEKAEKAASEAAVRAEKAATDAAVRAEKAATEAAVKAEKAATEAAAKATKVATTAFSLFGASKFGKQLVAAAATAQAAATTATKLPKQKESISRVGSRRQSTEESIDTDDEWYRHEMRELEEMEYQKQIEDIKPSLSVTHQMNLALEELCSVKPPIEKETCDSVEAERKAAQNSLPGPRRPKEAPARAEERKGPELKRSVMRLQSSDGEEEEEEEEEKVRRTKIRRRRRRSESSESEDEDATQSGPDSLIQDSSDDLLESDSKRKPPPAMVAIGSKEKEKSESSPSEQHGEISHASSGKASLSASQRAALAGHPRPTSGASGKFNGSNKGSPPKELSPSDGATKPEEEYWEGNEATGGYYDENGEWVEANGYYDENGYWIETGGYYDESGAWIEYAGYYDENGEWVEVENPQQQQQQIQDQAYYDDGGGGGGGGGGPSLDLPAAMPTVAEEEFEEEEPEATEEDNLNNSAGYFLAVAGVAVNLPPKQSTPANKKSAVSGRGDDDSCSSSYTDEAGDEDHDMDDLEEEEFVPEPEAVSAATMSKQQSEDHSNAESKGSGTRTLQQAESEDHSAALLSEQHQQHQLQQQDEQDDEQEHVNGVKDGHDQEADDNAEDDELKEEAKDSLVDIMARRKLAGNKGWSALSKTLKERKSELLESVVSQLVLSDNLTLRRLMRQPVSRFNFCVRQIGRCLQTWSSCQVGSRFGLVSTVRQIFS